MFRGSSRTKALLAIILASLIGWLYLTQASWMASTGRRIQKLEKERARLKRENAYLLSQIADLEAPSRLLARAQELGFGSPERVEHVIVLYHPTSTPAMAAEEKPSAANEGELGCWLESLLSKFALQLRGIRQQMAQ